MWRHGCSPTQHVSVYLYPSSLRLSTHARSVSGYPQTLGTLNSTFRKRIQWPSVILPTELRCCLRRCQHEMKQQLFAVPLANTRWRHTPVECGSTSTKRLLLSVSSKLAFVLSSSLASSHDCVSDVTVQFASDLHYVLHNASNPPVLHSQPLNAHNSVLNIWTVPYTAPFL
jgi:hypothetical protein